MSSRSKKLEGSGELWYARGRRREKERRPEERKRAGRSVHARRWPRIGALYENEKVTKAEVKSVHT